MSIRVKCILMLLAVGLVSLSVAGYLGYSSGKSNLSRSIMNHLTSVRASKARQIEAYFRKVRNEVLFFREARTVVDAMKGFQDAFDRLQHRDLTPSEMKELDAFYRDIFSVKLGRPDTEAGFLRGHRPATPAGRRLQYQYIVKNPHPHNERRLLDRGGGESEYGKIHERYHPLLRDLASRFGYDDLILVDARTGDVVYTVEKQTDLGTSLLTGSYRGINEGKAFASAHLATRPTDSVELVDFERSEPNFGSPAAFVASPIFDAGTGISGVVIIQLAITEIDRVMSGDREWQREGLGQTGETYLVGPDSLMRSDSRFLMEAPDRYFRDVSATGLEKETMSRIRQYGTSILLQPVNTEAARQAHAGISDTTTIRDYRGQAVLSSYAPLKIPGLSWSVIAEMDLSEAFQPVIRLQRALGLTLLASLAVITVLAFLFAKMFLRPVNALAAGALRIIGGDTHVTVAAQGKDELGVLGRTFNHMAASIREKTEAIEQKNRENEELLLNILPGPIAVRLKGGEARIADNFADVTVLFADIVNFTVLSSRVPADELVGLLNGLFTRFDNIAQKLGIEKIKTIGDAYMAVSGLPQLRSDHAKVMVEMGLAMLQATHEYGRDRQENLQLRIGINSGPVIAGVIGARRFIYDLWGDTVNVASRMESNGVIGTIQITGAVYEQLRDQYPFEPRGLIEVKGKGTLETWLLRAQEPGPEER
jgi:class 3 adenylate cyclase